MSLGKLARRPHTPAPYPTWPDEIAHHDARALAAYRLRKERAGINILKTLLALEDPTNPDAKLYPIDQETCGQEFARLREEVLPRIRAHNAALDGEPGTYLLPMAYPEGSPLHPAYDAGHATVAGACVTVLKAWFADDLTLADLGVVPVEATPGGGALQRWAGDPAELTVHGELDKLAANIALARSFAGVHWRSDYTESVRLGEAVALWLLCDQRMTYAEDYGFSLTTLDGTGVRLDRNNAGCLTLL